MILCFRFIPQEEEYDGDLHLIATCFVTIALGLFVNLIFSSKKMMYFWQPMIFFWLGETFTRLICYGNRTVMLKSSFRSFPGGAVVKNPPANAGDTGSSPGPGRSHMLRSN